MNKYYVVLHSCSNILFAILDKDQYRTFKNERNVDNFDIFKVSEKEAIQFRVNAGLDEDNTTAYYLDSDDDGDSGRVLITYEEEMMYNEYLYNCFTNDYVSSIKNMLEVVESDMIKFTEEEYDLISSYLEHLYFTTINSENIEALADEDPGYSIYDDAKLIIELVLKSYGFLVKEWWSEQRKILCIFWWG